MPETPRYFDVKLLPKDHVNLIAEFMDAYPIPQGKRPIVLSARLDNEERDSELRSTNLLAHIVPVSRLTVVGQRKGKATGNCLLIDERAAGVFTPEELRYIVTGIMFDKKLLTATSKRELFVKNTIAMAIAGLGVGGLGTHLINRKEPISKRKFLALTAAGAAFGGSSFGTVGRAMDIENFSNEAHKGANALINLMQGHERISKSIEEKMASEFPDGLSVTLDRGLQRKDPGYLLGQ